MSTCWAGVIHSTQLVRYISSIWMHTRQPVWILHASVNISVHYHKSKFTESCILPYQVPSITLICTYAVCMDHSVTPRERIVEWTWSYCQPSLHAYIHYLYIRFWCQFNIIHTRINVSELFLIQKKKHRIMSVFPKYIIQVQDKV